MNGLTPGNNQRGAMGFRGPGGLRTSAILILAAAVSGCSHTKEFRSDTMATYGQRERVLEWVRKAPFDDIRAQAARPNFSYEKWFEEGRALPAATEALVELLEKEILEYPSGDGMRISYALGWIGDKRPSAIKALVRALGSKDITLRVEAVAALGRLGDPSVLPLLERLLRDQNEDINVRGNACISIGRLGVPSSEGLLRDTLNDPSPFLVRCAEEGLKKLHAGGSQR
jgi:HEAT repeats